ncbi:MAG: metallophosphoesterase family protein [Nitrospirota bacterium]|nr:metallophosphoesterase family protein [Nitrospirota bacterium]
MMIGVISDTHGLVRPEVLEIFKGAELIIHAGDIGGRAVLKALEAIAPVKAVRGNNDRETWAAHIPHDQVIEYGSHVFYVLHELEHLDLDPAAAEFSAVIFGHSHRPLAETKKGVLYLNPGSAGPRRFSLPIALAKLHVKGTSLTPEIIELST